MPRISPSAIIQFKCLHSLSAQMSVCLLIYLWADCVSSWTLRSDGCRGCQTFLPKAGWPAQLCSCKLHKAEAWKLERPQQARHQSCLTVFISFYQSFKIEATTSSILLLIHTPSKKRFRFFFFRNKDKLINNMNTINNNELE